MTDKDFKNLNELLGTSKKAFESFDNQMKGLSSLFEGTIQKLNGKEKQKVQHLQAMTNRVISIAKKGGDYNEALDNIKKIFKVDINGSDSNK